MMGFIKNCLDLEPFNLLTFILFQSCGIVDPVFRYPLRDCRSLSAPNELGALCCLESLSPVNVIREFFETSRLSGLAFLLETTCS